MSPHPFSLRQLQYLVAADELRSFSKAAARCHTSQPSLSAQPLLGASAHRRDPDHRTLPLARARACPARGPARPGQPVGRGENDRSITTVPCRRPRTGRARRVPGHG
ncbi:MAG: LysR family transcriptional regulator [Myxococcales bacterium]|nr:LysR family transcriptional regulator [Myxococcales bacterium]